VARLFDNCGLFERLVSVVLHAQGGCYARARWGRCEAGGMLSRQDRCSTGRGETVMARVPLLARAFLL